MSGNGLAWKRMGTICDELATYGITATPSDERPSWLAVHAASLAFTEMDRLWAQPFVTEVFVSDEDMLRLDCLEIVLSKVTAVVGHPC